MPEGKCCIFKFKHRLSQNAFRQFTWMIEYINKYQFQNEELITGLWNITRNL